MTTKEAFEAMQAADKEAKLRAAGWKQVPCRYCHGARELMRGPYQDIPYKCTRCEGEGQEWEAPITK